MISTLVGLQKKSEVLVQCESTFWLGVIQVMNHLILIGVLIMSFQVEAKTVWKGRAVLVIKKDKVAEFKKAVAKIIKPTLKEKGCLSYEGYQVIDEHGKETNRFEFHEVWVTKEAMLIDHKEKSNHMKTFFAEIKADTKDSLLESFEVDGKTVTVLEGLYF